MNFKIFQICTFETFRLIHNITKGDTETRAGHCSVTWAEAESDETRHSFAGAHWPMRIKYFVHRPIRSGRATARCVTQRSLRVVKYRSGSVARAPVTRNSTVAACARDNRDNTASYNPTLERASHNHNIDNQERFKS